MLRKLIVSCCLGLLWSMSGLAQAPVAPSVELEVFTTGRVAAQTTQDWARMLNKLNLRSVRIRAEQPGDTTKLITAGTPQLPSYRVIGSLNANAELTLPGGRFTLRDAAGIARWIETLGDHGAAGVTEQKIAFGLTKDQLAEVRTDLSSTVDFATKGQPAIKVLRKLAAGRVPLVIDPNLEKQLEQDEPVRDEFQGLARGTALAAILRPVAGSLVPRKPAKANVEIALLPASEAAELWPIGWATEEQPQKLVPKFFDTLNADIDGVTAQEALDVVQARLEVPFLYDHNSLAQAKVKLDQPIKINAGKTYYGKLLTQICNKLKCQAELRVDEAGKPLMWITTR